MRYKVTLDTTILGNKKLASFQKLIINKPVDLTIISVSERETRGTKIQPLLVQLPETAVWDESEWDNAVWGGPVAETFVLGESELGRAALGSQKGENLFEELLKIISSNSFPKIGQRHNLTKGQKHLLRDVMILEAHCREKRHFLVSDDTKAFGKPSSILRQQLEKICNTRIMTYDEFGFWIQGISDKKDLN